jgi:hypothetical protein
MRGARLTRPRASASSIPRARFEPGATSRPRIRARPVERPCVGWVVKDWSSDGIERLLADRALDGLRATRQAADRDARRARRVAGRAAAEADARLEALESLARQLQLAVRTHRAELRMGAPADSGNVRLVPPPGPALTAIEPGPGATRRDGRASMRSSPLTELFRPTEPRRPTERHHPGEPPAPTAPAS